MQLSMRTATSADGTAIAWYAGPAGPPLVCIGGALCDHTMWAGLLGQLPGAAAHLVERRGRGASGDRPGSGPGDEVADVQAVLREVASPAAPAVLFGHSSGALLALRVAASSSSLVRRVVAYEPPPAPPVAGVGARLRELLAADDRAAAVRCFMVQAVGVPEQAAQVRFVAGQPASLALAPTLTHDVDLAEQGIPDDLARDLTVPVVLLLGTESEHRMAEHVSTLADRLPDAELHTLAGQAHFALAAAPELVAPHVLAALRNP